MRSTSLAGRLHHRRGGRQPMAMLLHIRPEWHPKHLDALPASGSGMESQGCGTPTAGQAVAGRIRRGRADSRGRPYMLRQECGPLSRNAQRAHARPSLLQACDSARVGGPVTTSSYKSAMSELRRWSGAWYPITGFCRGPQVEPACRGQGSGEATSAFSYSMPSQ